MNWQVVLGWMLVGSPAWLAIVLVWYLAPEFRGFVLGMGGGCLIVSLVSWLRDQ